MITFSFRPRSRSTLPEIAASVRTRVVSWKDAADNHDVVFSAALLRPDADLMRDWVLANLFVHGANGHLFGRDGDLARVARPNAAALGVSGQLLAFHDVVAGLDQRLHLGLDRVGNLELLLGDHAHLARALLADYLELPVDLGDDGLALGDASLEKLLHAG